MKIQSYKKLKNGQYKIQLEDREILLHEDLILKNRLLIKKEIDQHQLEKLQAENKKYLIYDEALNYLKRRLRSKQEMYMYLVKKEYDSSLIEEILLMLEKQKYLDDVVYTQSYIHDKITLSNEGPYKIIKELQDKNIDQNTIDTYINCFSEKIQTEKIEKYIQKAVKTNRKKSKRMLEQKIVNDLSKLGYPIDCIRKSLYLLEDISDEDIKKKEYEKLYSRLSKKYSGNELEYKVKNGLIQKGFY